MYSKALSQKRRRGRLLVSKTVKVMQLTSMVLLAACLQVSAAAYAQQVTISRQHTSLKQVFNEIRKQTGYNFVYTNEDLRDAAPVSLDMQGASVTAVLDACFAHQPLTYKIDDKIIIVKRKLSEADVPLPDITVTGTIRDSASGSPLGGVTIQVKGTTTGATTDADGRFTLAAPPDAVLVVSFLGYAPKQIQLAGRTEISIPLAASVTGLNQLVVVGYGTQKKIDLSGSVSTVRYDQQLQNRPITDLSQAISGLAAGVSVEQTSGQPGADGAVIRIRGVGTINNSDPLVIIDGIVGSLNNINPNDVASISVLKDAASAAIYGSRAANGVILVTTKRGVKGKTVVNYNINVGSTEATHLFKPVTDYVTYMQLMNGIQKADNPANADLFKPATIDAWKNATDRTLYPNTNWVDVLFHPGTIINQNLSVSGGNQTTDFFLSLGYLSNEGILNGTDMKKYSLRLNLDHQLSAKIKIGANISAYWKDVKEPIDVMTALYYGANSTPGTTPYMVVDGEKRYGGRNTVDESPNAINPLQYLDTWFYPQSGWYNFGKLYASWDILPHLTLDVTGSAETYNKESKQYKLAGPIQDLWDFQLGQIETNNENVPAALTQDNATSYALTFYSTLHYDRTFAKAHHLEVLLGTSREKNHNASFSGQKQGFPSNDTWELNAGLDQPVVGGTSSGYALSSYFGRVNYDYREKYLLEANLRYDGSSRFSEPRRWGLFPSFSAAWRLSEEGFFKQAGLTPISHVKFRASWGQLGNENIGLYQFLNLYSAGQNYTFGGGVASGIAPTALSNPDITWENTATTDAGADIGLFGDHLNLTFDWYDRKTRNILVRLPLSSLYGGLTAPYQNVGVMDNRGWELDIDYQGKAGDWQYAVGGNLSDNTNKVIHFQGNPDVIQSTGNNSIIKEGLPMNALFGYIAEGTFKTQDEIDKAPKQKLSGSNKPGDLKYKDINGDGVINGDDRTYLGSTVPRYTYGFHAEVSYRGFTVSALFQGISGVKRYLSNLWYTSAVRYGREINSYFLDAWSPDHPNSNIPRLTTDNNGDNTQASSFWVQNGSYLRLKNLQVAYSFPSQWLSRTFVSSAQLYVNGQNLLTWTHYNGLDPETGNYTDYQMEYPNVRVLSAGLNVSF